MYHSFTCLGGGGVLLILFACFESVCVPVCLEIHCVTLACLELAVDQSGLKFIRRSDFLCLSSAGIKSSFLCYSYIILIRLQGCGASRDFHTNFWTCF